MNLSGHVHAQDFEAWWRETVDSIFDGTTWPHAHATSSVYVNLDETEQHQRLQRVLESADYYAKCDNKEKKGKDRDLLECVMDFSFGVACNLFTISIIYTDRMVRLHSYKVTLTFFVAYTQAHHLKSFYCC